VTLTAIPAADAVVQGWTGCDATAGPHCTVTMTAARAVSASFRPTTVVLTVAPAGSADGTVTSEPGGIACPPACSASYAFDALVELTAVAAPGAVFRGWTGACAGAGPVCTVTAAAAATATATFSKTFTDGTGPAAAVSAGTTVVRAAHVAELRAAVETLRARHGLPAPDWTDPALQAAVTVAKAVHVQELRTALVQAYQAAGRTPPAFADSPPAARTTPIRAVHLSELRQAVRALE
jgi:uncharacterized repeat protein (TIGR02543 family)